MKAGALAAIVVILVGTNGANAGAAPYPPTNAGLERLVSHDAALLPAADAQHLRQKLNDWEHGIGVTCSGQGKGQLCYPAAKDMIAQIQAHICSFDGNVVEDHKWSRINKPLSQAIDATMQPPSDVKLERNTPQIVNPVTPQARAFNAAARHFIDHVFVAEGSWGRGTASLPKLSEYVRSDHDEDVIVDCVANPNLVAGIVSITLTWSTYTHGAAHAFSDSDEFNWNVQKQRLVTVGDIFNLKTDWKRGVATAIAKSDRNGTAGFNMSELESLIAGPQLWTISKSGLRITLNEVNSYMTRGPDVTVAWPALYPYLNRDSPISQPLSLKANDPNK